MSARPAGWYPDESGTIRYWNGSTWADSQQYVGLSSQAEAPTSAQLPSPVAPASGSTGQDGHASPQGVPETNAAPNFVAPAASPAPGTYAAPGPQPAPNFAAPNFAAPAASPAPGTYAAPGPQPAPGSYGPYAGQPGVYGAAVPAYIAPPVKETNNMAIAGFVLALAALLLSWAPVLNLATWASGLVFSILGLRKEPKGLAIAGLVISLLGLVAVLLIMIAFGAFFAFVYS